MAPTLKASEEGKTKIDIALRYKGWNKGPLSEAIPAASLLLVLPYLREKNWTGEKPLDRQKLKSSQLFTKNSLDKIFYAYQVTNYTKIESDIQCGELTAKGISYGTWNSFLYKKPINTKAFKAYCKVLGLNWEEIKEDPPQSDRKKPIKTETQSYRGSEVSDRTLALVEEYTQLFVGREDVLSELDKLLTQTDKRYLTITAPAGFGKTALLANWVKSRQGNDYFIACHFFRQRDEITCSVANAYRNLLQQIYNYCESSKALPYDENQLRQDLYDMVKAWASKPLVIIIDGLDEAEGLFSPPFPTPLPPNVFVIASARKFEEEEQNYLSGWTNNEEPIWLNHLTKEAIADWLRETGKCELVSLAQDESFVAQVCDRTEGIPLFLKYLIDELVEVAQQGEESAIRKTLEATPKGFPEYIHQQYQALDRLKDWHSRPELRKIFYFLTIAKGELSSDDLVELMEESPVGLPWRVSRWFKIRRLEDCLVYSFAHSTLAEQFAILPEIKANTKKSQKKLIQYCAQWEEYQSHYALRHYAEHLTQTEKWDELYELARNKTFAATQQKHLPDEPNLSLKTVQTALLGAAETDNVTGMAEFMLVHARRLVQTTEQDSPLDALRKGYLERAWRLTDLYEIERRILWYLLLAWELKDTGRFEEAEETLKQLQQQELPRLSTYPDIKWHSQYATYLLAHVFEVSENICTSLEQKLLDDRYRCILCAHLRNFGNFIAALKTVESIRPESTQVLHLINIAKAQAQKGDIEYSATFTNALEIVNTLVSTLNWKRLIEEIAKAQIEVGDRASAQATLTEALETADNKIDNPLHQVNAFVYLANVQAEVGMVEEASATLQKINDRPGIEKLFISIGIAKGGLYIGKKAKVKAIYAKHLSRASGIANEYKQTDFLQKFVIEQAEAREFADARKTAKKIDCSDRPDALIRIAEAYAKAEDFTTALEIATEIDIQLMRAKTLGVIGEIQVQTGQTEAARATFANVLKIEKPLEASISFIRLLALARVAEVQVKNAQKEVGLTTASIACEIAQSMENPMETANVLAGILVQILIEAEKIQEAKIICDRAYQIAQQISDNEEYQRSKTFGFVAEAQARLGEFDVALRTLETIRMPYSYVNALRSIVQLQIEAKPQQIEKYKIVLNKADEYYKNADSISLILANKVQLLTIIAVARSTIGETEAALATFADLLEAAKTKEQRERDEDFSIIAIGYVEVGEFSTAIKISKDLEDGEQKISIFLAIACEQFKKRQQVTTLDIALAAKEKIEDAQKRLEALKSIAQIQAIAGNGEEALRILEAMLNDRNTHLRDIALLFAETGDRVNFKRLLIPCAYYLDTAYQMCGYLARLYPEQASAVAKVLSELNEGER
ncbi:ATP-binding protein [Microcoleus sp. A2-C5]|uniref:ATP-binding protein n=1 Tax=unclassified Microcoleus TaxID=2642155 RepID=UPI002FCF4E94